jgi:hypothetical protein
MIWSSWLQCEAIILNVPLERVIFGIIFNMCCGMKVLQDLVVHQLRT